jgi:hypothetical protein
MRVVAWSGLQVNLNLNGPDSDRLVGYDNAHAVAGQGRSPAKDYKHRLRTMRRYDYTDAAALLAAFWDDVESV